ncbi:two-component system sensor histidine kinase DesK [Prauserella rugosa]|uniref:Two-component system sensor histidine kinase DesK n=2 Tax=Prauserella rugosa TaxID=43354 RepID=A0A660CIF6_9PSEU|nr:two-component system sensor histidine kinase DesK [Prauserella rugosa]
MRWMRRYTWGTLGAAGAVVAVILARDLATAPFGTANRIALGALIVGLVVQRARFVGYAARGVDFAARKPVEQILTCSVAVVAWAHAARYTDMPAVWALLPAAVGGASIVSAPHEYRRNLGVGLLAATVVTGSLALSWRHHPEVESASFSIVLAAVVVGAFFVIDVVSVRFWELVLELDKARALAADLATARERLRFAADLHDIQGHSLQAIVLKGQLAERLVGTDDEAARRHAAELTELARSAIEDTRTLAQGYRDIGLETELHNAVELMTAAGIDVDVRGDPASIPPPLQRAFAALVREGTTNILRHSRAARCTLEIGHADRMVRMALGNDGVRHHGDADTGDTGDGGGSGVSGLRERFATVGGDATAGRTEHDWFELSGWAPEPEGRR